MVARRARGRKQWSPSAPPPWPPPRPQTGSPPAGIRHLIPWTIAAGPDGVTFRGRPAGELAIFFGSELRGDRVNVFNNQMLVRFSQDGKIV